MRSPSDLWGATHFYTFNMPHDMPQKAPGFQYTSGWVWTKKMDDTRVFIGDCGLYWIDLDWVLVGGTGFEPVTLGV